MVAAIVLLATLALAASRIRRVPDDALVVDGDSLRVRHDPWRLAGLDAPEWDQPGGRAAADALRAMLVASRVVAVLLGRDAYGRRLVVLVDARGPLAWRLAASGRVHGEGPVGTALTLLARLRGAGLWSSPAVHPRIWRMARRR